MNQISAGYLESQAPLTTMITTSADWSSIWSVKTRTPSTGPMAKGNADQTAISVFGPLRLRQTFIGSEETCLNISGLVPLPESQVSRAARATLMPVGF
jgi:hypothetical protein